MTVTYDLTRLQRLPTDTHYLVTLGGEDLVDPATVIDRMEYDHPLYTPSRSPRSARLPEIDTDRIAFAGAYHGWGFHEDGARSGLRAAAALGADWASRRRRRALAALRAHPLAASDHDPAHGGAVHATFDAARTPGWSTSTTCPTTAASPGSRRATTSATRTLAARQRRRVPRRPRRRPQAAGSDPDGRAPAGARLLLQPDQRVLVLRRGRALGGRGGRGAQHLRRPARLPRAPRRAGPGAADKEMYVSPFHGVDGWYDLAVPVPTDRLHVAVTLRDHDDGAGFARRFGASLTGTRPRSRSAAPGRGPAGPS